MYSRSFSHKIKHKKIPRVHYFKNALTLLQYITAICICHIIILTLNKSSQTMLANYHYSLLVHIFQTASLLMYLSFHLNVQPLAHIARRFLLHLS